jgi:hypothetical protein
VHSEYWDQFCIGYLDNILVYLNTLKEHAEHILYVIAMLKEAGLNLKLPKSELNMQKISFVGFVITLQGVEMEPNSIQTFTEWLEHESYRNIQVFLHFAKFYRCIIGAFLKIVQLITVMQKGGMNWRLTGEFVLTLTSKQVFQQLQDELMQALVLVHFNRAKLICLETDTSGYAIAGITLL